MAESDSLEGSTDEGDPTPDAGSADAKASESPPRESPRAASTHDESANDRGGPDPFDQIERALCEALTEIDSVSMVPGAAGSPPLAVIQTRADPATLAPRVTALLGQRRLVAQPLVVGRHQWQVLEEVLPGKKWLDALDQSQARLNQLARLQTPRQMRRFLLDTLRSHRAVLDFAQRSEQLPLWLTLELCALVVEDTLSLLFATKREAYTEDETTTERFERLFVATADFLPGDVQLALELRGLAHQARLLFGLAPDVRIEWLGALKRAHRLLDRFKHYTSTVFVTEAERRRRRRLTWAGVSLAGLLAVGGAVAGLLATRPLEPLASPAAIRAPGGIVGAYYNGRRFQTEVLRRTDRQISFSTTGSPAPGIQRNNFSIRWQGYLFFAKPGKQVLCTECDDGARLFFNGEQLIDDWKIQGTNRTCATVRVKKGWYPLKVEYFEVSRGAVMRLLQGDEERRVRVVPAQHLCCRDDSNKSRTAPTKPKPPLAPTPRAAVLKTHTTKTATPGKNTPGKTTPGKTTPGKTKATPGKRVAPAKLGRPAKRPATPVTKPAAKKRPAPKAVR